MSVPGPVPEPAPARPEAPAGWRTHPDPSAALGAVPVLGLLPRIGRDPLGLLVDASRLGDAVALDLGIRRSVLVSHPDLVKRVLQDNRANYPKSVLYEKLRPAFGNGLLTSEGDFWAVQRRLIQPAFAHHRLEGMCRLMVEEARARAARLDAAAAAGAVIDMTAVMSSLTLSVVVRAMFGVQLEEDERRIGEAVEFLNGFGNRRIRSLVTLPLWVPTRQNRVARRALDYLDSVVYRIIRARRAASPASVDAGGAAGRPDDLLAMLLAARYDDGSAMPERQVRDEVMTIFLAGHESTAVSLAWTLDLLDAHPHVQERLREELRTVLGDGDPAYADLPRLPYLRMVLEESMRVRPPVWSFSRSVIEEDELGPARVKPGDVVFLSPWAMHRDTRWWDDPEAFSPERFAPAAAEKRPRYAYFPFGGGPRVCVGAGFAMAEGQLVLACLLRRFRFRLAAPRPVAMRPLVTLRPHPAMPMRVERVGG